MEAVVNGGSAYSKVEENWEKIQFSTEFGEFNRVR